MNELFLDTSFAIALSSPNDQFHSPAVALAGKIKLEKRRWITTRFVFIEIGNSLARFRFRSAAITLLNNLERDPTVRIEPVSEAIYQKAYQLFQQRPDKEWGMTDCISFIAMREHGLTDALTADDHFEQAGFRALLRG